MAPSPQRLIYWSCILGLILAGADSDPTIHVVERSQAKLPVAAAPDENESTKASRDVAPPRKRHGGSSLFAPGRYTDDPATGKPAIQYETPRAVQSDIPSVQNEKQMSMLYDRYYLGDPDFGPGWDWGWGGWDTGFYGFPSVPSPVVPHPVVPHPVVPHPVVPHPVVPHPHVPHPSVPHLPR